jgi:chemotaxis protein methyltransferase CheR
MTNSISDPFLAKIAEFFLNEHGLDFFNQQKDFFLSKIKNHLDEKSYSSTESYYKDFEKSEVAKNQLLAILTTHYTYFFREFLHFEFLLNQTDWIKTKTQSRPLKVWCAACSYGQEIYSLALFFKTHYPHLPVMFFASDVSKEALDRAQNGVYRFEEVSAIPALYLENNWLRGKKELSNFAKIKDDLHKKINFFVCNLIDFSQYPKETFDLIFCRNVFIYFNQKAIEKTIENFVKILNPSSFLFLGVSESLADRPKALTAIGSSIFSFDPTPQDSVIQKKETLKIPQETNQNQTIIRVFLVDDSNVILNLVSSIFSKSSEFKVVATAKNGQEAFETKNSVEFDLMILDIHMPILNGIEYLEKVSSQNHPPVVMLSSVSRHDSSLALKALELGALDYIEKPKHEDFKIVEHELLTKTKLAVRFHQMLIKNQTFAFEKIFSWNQLIPSVDQAQCLIIVKRSEISLLKSYLEALVTPFPSLCLIFDNVFADYELEKEILIDRLKLKNFRFSDEPKMNHLTLSNFDQTSSLKNQTFKKRLFVFFHLPSESSLENLFKEFEGDEILIHEFLYENSIIPDMIYKKHPRICPLSSLAYHTYQFFLNVS